MSITMIEFCCCCCCGFDLLVFAFAVEAVVVLDFVFDVAGVVAVITVSCSSFTSFTGYFLSGDGGRGRRHDSRPTADCNHYCFLNGIGHCFGFYKGSFGASAMRLCFAMKIALDAAGDSHLVAGDISEGDIAMNLPSKTPWFCQGKSRAQKWP